MEKASWCQSECQSEKSVSPQALEGMLLPVFGSVGKGLHAPNRYAYQAHGPTYVFLDQTLSPGFSPLFAVAPGGSERALMLASGLVAQPLSHDGQPVKEELLIMAFAPVWLPNGAPLEFWYAMKLVPQLPVWLAVHTVEVAVPCGGALAAMKLGWKTN